MLIDLSTYEINMILHALAEQPYKDVVAVIADIKEQISGVKEEREV